MKSNNTRMEIMSKIGRNAPCPCGSGRKYKHCCGKKDNIIPFPGTSNFGSESTNHGSFGSDIPTFMEQRGTPNEATAVMNDLKKAIGDRVFDSVEEVRSFAGNFYKKENSEPVKDFLGISPTQMKMILDHSFTEKSNLVSFNIESCTDKELLAVPYVKMSLYILNFIKEKGKLKATLKLGNFPRILVTNLYDNVSIFYNESMFSVRDELDVPILGLFRELLLVSGVIKKIKGYFQLTKKGLSIVEENNLILLYKTIFNKYFDRLNWLYGTRFDKSLEFVQTARIFNLYILHKKADQFTKASTLTQYFIDAFPFVLEQLPKRGYSTPTKMIQRCFKKEFLENVAFYFGLVEDENQSVKEFDKFISCRTTPLFKKMFTWHFDK